MPACPPYPGETSTTLLGVSSRHVSPSPPEHRVTGRIWPRPPPRAITRRRTQRQSYRRSRGGQLTRTHPSRTAHHRQLRAPAGLGRNRTASRQSPEPTAATETAEQGNAERPADTSAGSARKPAPGPRTTRVVERTRKRDTVAETHFQSNLSRWVSRYVADLYCTVLYDINAVLLQYAPNLLNLLLIHTTNANATANLTVTVLHNFKLKRDTVQTKNDFPAQ